MVFLRILVRNTKQSKGGRCRLRFPFGFNRSQFGFLNVTHFVTGLITQNDNGEDSRHAEAGCNRKGTLSEGEVTTAQHIVGADAEDEHRAADVARCHGMDEFHLCDRVQDQLREADHFHTHGFEVEIRRNRVLHPAVRDEDPQC